LCTTRYINYAGFTLLIIGLLLSGCNSKKPILTEKEFARIYMDSLSKAHPEAKFELDSALTIHAKQGEQEFQHFIDNIYTTYRTDPDSISSILSHYVRSTMDLYVGKGRVDISDVVPIIKPIEYLEEVNSMGKEPNKFPLINENYNEQLVIVFAEDKEDKLSYLTNDYLDSFSVSKDSLKAIAYRNLQRILPEVKLKGDNGLYMVDAGGLYEASLLLSPTMWTKENFHVSGELVVAIPTRDFLIVTGSNDKKGIKEVKEIVVDWYNKESYPISEYLYKWTGKRFERFE
jgi:uncharacterized protein YtpQ (UPF0354 family)